MGKSVGFIGHESLACLSSTSIRMTLTGTAGIGLGGDDLGNHSVNVLLAVKITHMQNL